MAYPYNNSHNNSNEQHLLDLASAVAVLRASGVLIYPTETFFAIGSLACDAAGIEAVFCAKMRPPKRTLPLLAADMTQVAQVVDIQALPPGLSAFWPGPLTILLPARSTVPKALVNDQGKAAVRITSHPQAATLARAAGGPLTSSSANISGHASVSHVQQLEKALLARVGGVLAGCEQTAGGEPSTVIEPLTGRAVRILRYGAISPDMLTKSGWQLV